MHDACKPTASNRAFKPALGPNRHVALDFKIHVYPSREGRGGDRACFASPAIRRSALAGLVAPDGLVDDIEAAAAAHDTIVAVTQAERLDRILDLHCQIPKRSAMAVSGRRKHKP